PNEKALTSSSGANWIIEKASVYESLEDCLKDVTYVYATTARPRGMIKEVITPEQAGRDMRARMARGGALHLEDGAEDARFPRRGEGPDDLEAHPFFRV
ncbi:MAG: RNA methyltransferase, partial [Holophaga sp.]|nr:RNA methyltransferase [Holophaga sp.]